LRLPVAHLLTVSRNRLLFLHSSRTWLPQTVRRKHEALPVTDDCQGPGDDVTTAMSGFEQKGPIIVSRAMAAHNSGAHIASANTSKPRPIVANAQTAPQRKTSMEWSTGNDRSSRVAGKGTNVNCQEAVRFRPDGTQAVSTRRAGA
jgi:hypothetical protein